MKNILIISQYFWPENFIINEFSQILKGEKNNVTIVTGSSGYHLKSKILQKKRKQFKNNFNIIEIKTFPRVGKFGLVINYLSFILMGIFSLPFKLKNKNFDTILVYGTSPVIQIILGYYVKLLKKSRLIIWIQDLWPELLEIYYSKLYKFFSSVIEKIILFYLSKADFLFCQSRGYLEHYNSKLPLKKELTKVLPNFCNEIPISRKIIKNENINIFYVGNIGKSQNIDFLIDVIDQLKKRKISVNFIFYGSGSEKIKLEKYIKVNNATNIFLNDLVSPKKIFNILNDQADAVIITLEDNYGLNLTIPSRLQTFLYIGKPVIGSINGEAQRIIKESKCGICVNANDKLKLIEAIQIFKSKNITDIEKYQKNAINYYKNNFSKEKVLSIWKKELKY
jgi:glycosyltransferase involved in cell wall biosynthesis